MQWQILKWMKVKETSMRAQWRALAVSIVLVVFISVPGEALAQEFVLNHWATVKPAPDWSFLAGNFSDDGKLDVMGYHPSNGTLWVGTNTGPRFSFDKWYGEGVGRGKNLDPPDGWTFVVGNFAGDSKPDLVGYHPSNGTLWVFTNTGTEFSVAKWYGEGVGEGKNLDPPDRWTFLSGNFAGDSKPDLVGYHPSNGTLWVFTNTGTEFSIAKWYGEGVGRGKNLDPPDGWTFVVGNFTGDGKPDLVGYHPSNGTLWVFTNTGTEFSVAKWYGEGVGEGKNLDPPDRWTFLSDNFAGDSKPDLVGYHPSNGTLWVFSNTGSYFSADKWYGTERNPDGTIKNLAPPDRWTFQVGNFAGDDKPDLVGYHPSNGTLWVGTNTGSGFSLDRWAEIAYAARPTLLVGNFAGDSKLDVLAYLPLNGALWVGINTGPRGLEGYAWPLSAAPGEEIAFKVSGRGSGKVRFFRHKANVRGVTSILMGSKDFDPQVQSTLTESWRNGAGWSTSFKLTIPDDWPSGIYSAKLTDREGDEFHITFIVKPAPNSRSGLAVLANVNTWLAYNRWGGEGKYSGAAQVSFMRPNPGASPVSGKLHLTRGELWILGWLEDEGYHPDVYTDIDFHNGAVHGSYKTLILSTHPEYWSVQMYQNLCGFLDNGGSILYLGGNGIYENGEYTVDQTGMVFRAGMENFGAANENRAVALFRRLDPPRPERALLGVATERCSVEGGAYQVQQADHQFFRGADLRNGHTFGNVGLNTGWGGSNGKASGWEVDTSNGPGATSIPTYCASGDPDDWPVPAGPGLPEGLEILAIGQNWLEDRQWKGAEMVYYAHPGGGFVFAVGSITFGGSLVLDSRIQQIVRNALTEAERMARQ